jgi:hypothetical protein
MLKSVFISLLFILFLGCNQPKTNKKYIVLSVFNEVILETDDRDEAYETAYNLTMMGRIFQSKPYYFVTEKIQ